MEKNRTFHKDKHLGHNTQLNTQKKIQKHKT